MRVFILPRDITSEGKQLKRRQDREAGGTGGTRRVCPARPQGCSASSEDTAEGNAGSRAPASAEGRGMLSGRAPATGPEKSQRTAQGTGPLRPRTGHSASSFSPCRDFLLTLSERGTRRLSYHALGKYDFCLGSGRGFLLMKEVPCSKIQNTKHRKKQNREESRCPSLESRRGQRAEGSEQTPPNPRQQRLWNVTTRVALGASQHPSPPRAPRTLGVPRPPRAAWTCGFRPDSRC